MKLDKSLIGKTFTLDFRPGRKYRITSVDARRTHAVATVDNRGEKHRWDGDMVLAILRRQAK